LGGEDTSLSASLLISPSKAASSRMSSSCRPSSYPAGFTHVVSFVRLLM
jgi:hypothetical protein